MAAQLRFPLMLAHCYGAATGVCVLRSLTLCALLCIPMPLIAVADDRPTTLAAAGGNPLALSAGAFLSWYWTVLFVLAVVTLVLRALRGRWHSSIVPSSRIRHDAYAVAYLAGGPGRVIEAALASLIDHGALRVNAVTRDLITEGMPPPDRPKIERRIWELVGSSRHVGNPARFRDEMLQQNQTSLALIRDRLRRDGLLGKPHWQPKAAKLLICGYIGLIGIGVVRVFVGMVAGRPVGFLVISLVVTVVVGWLLLHRFDRERETRKGAQLLADGKSRLGQGSGNTVLWNVALLGIAGQGIGPLADLEHVIREPSRGLGSSDDESRFGLGADKSGGSGGSGGSGCGGGGCGGCGG